MKKILACAVILSAIVCSCKPETGYENFKIEYQTQIHVNNRHCSGTDQSGMKAAIGELELFTAGHICSYTVSFAATLDKAFEEADAKIASQLATDAQEATEFLNQLRKKLNNGSGYGESDFELKDIEIIQTRLIGDPATCVLNTISNIDPLVYAIPM